MVLAHGGSHYQILAAGPADDMMKQTTFIGYSTRELGLVVLIGNSDRQCLKRCALDNHRRES